MTNYHKATEEEKASALYLLDLSMPMTVIAETLGLGSPSTISSWRSARQDTRWEPIDLSPEREKELDRIYNVWKGIEPPDKNPAPAPKPKPPKAPPSNGQLAIVTPDEPVPPLPVQDLAENGGLPPETGLNILHEMFGERDKRILELERENMRLAAELATTQAENDAQIDRKDEQIAHLREGLEEQTRRLLDYRKVLDYEMEMNRHD